MVYHDIEHLVDQLPDLMSNLTVRKLPEEHVKGIFILLLYSLFLLLTVKMMTI